MSKWMRFFGTPGIPVTEYFIPGEILAESTLVLSRSAFNLSNDFCFLNGQFLFDGLNSEEV